MHQHDWDPAFGFAQQLRTALEYGLLSAPSGHCNGLWLKPKGGLCTQPILSSADNLTHKAMAQQRAQHSSAVHADSTVEGLSIAEGCHLSTETTLQPPPALAMASVTRRLDRRALIRPSAQTLILACYSAAPCRDQGHASHPRIPAEDTAIEALQQYHSLRAGSCGPTLLQCSCTPGLMPSQWHIQCFSATFICQGRI